MSNLMINQLNGGVLLTATMSATAGMIPVQLPATASVPNNTGPMTVAVLAGVVATSSGIGNMAVQNASAVSISGGTVTSTGGSVLVTSSGSTASQSTGLQYIANDATWISYSLSTSVYAQMQILQAHSDGTSSIAIMTVGTNHSIQFANGAQTLTLMDTNSNTQVPGGLSVASGAIPSIGVVSGAGIPSASQPQGTLYLRTDGSATTTRAYINTTGSTVWAGILTTA